MEQKTNRWAFTNWDKPKVNLALCDYLIYQKERCPLTGKEHYQGYVEFKKDYLLKQVKQIFRSKQIFVDRARKSRMHNLLYCTKSNTFVGDRLIYNSQQPSDELDDVFNLGEFSHPE